MNFYQRSKFTLVDKCVGYLNFWGYLGLFKASKNLITYIFSMIINRT